MNKLKVFSFKIKENVTNEASRGFYPKWRIPVNVNGERKFIWIKAGNYEWGDYGHEGIMEVVTSNLANELGIKDVVQYKPCILHLTDSNGNTTSSIGCYSFEFTEKDEEVVSFAELGVPVNCYNNAIKDVASITSISEEEVRDYIDRCLLIDSLVLNVDRHGNNLAVIKNRKTGKFRLCPVFDFGLAMRGLECVEIETRQAYDDYDLFNFNAKPFSHLHDSQLELTHFKDNIDGKIELLHMFEDKGCKRTIALIDKLFEYFGYDYIEQWDSLKRHEVDILRAENKISNYFILPDRKYLISAIKRRMEVVLLGRAMPWSLCQESVDRETAILKDYMKY